MNRMRLPALLLLAALSVVSGCGETDPYLEAESLTARKRYSPAIVIYDEILAENPTAYRALIGRGRAYAASRKFDRAMEDYELAIETLPDDPEAYYRRAMLFEAMGELGRAKLDEETAHSLDPNYRKAFAEMENAMVPILDWEEDQLPVAGEEDVDIRTTKFGDEEDDPASASETASAGNSQLVNLPLMMDYESSKSHRSLMPQSNSASKTPAFEFLRDPFTKNGNFSWSPTPGVPPTATKPAPSAKATSPTASKTPASAPSTTASSRPVVAPGSRAPNPYVKQPATPAPSPSPSDAGTPSTVPRATGAPGGAPAGGASTPVATPFPQAPPVRTGR